MMWFETEVIFPRIVKSFLWAIIVQECLLSSLFLLFKLAAWNPFYGIIDWVFYLIHWKTLIYRCILYLTTGLIGALNIRYYSVQKHIPSTRFEKLINALSPSHIQHFLATFVLGAVASYCCIGLFHNFDLSKTSLLASCFQIKNEFEYFFVIQHGCYTGMMFSLKYFICCLYLLKFSLDQKPKGEQIKSQTSELFRDAVTCILKSVFWYYLMFFIIGPFLPNSFFTFPYQNLSTIENTLYSLLSPKLFIVTVLSGTIIFFNWSLYMFIFNSCVAERYSFYIDLPGKQESNKCLSVALQSPQTNALKYLAALDLRLLSQHDMNKRELIFAISQPGGHPYQWNAISEICVSSLQEILEKLRNYTVAIAAKEFKLETTTAPLRTQIIKDKNPQPLPSATKKVLECFRNWSAFGYFFEELPNAKIRQIFSSSQTLVWMAEALGFLLAASYIEDKYGVVQQMLPKIITLFLDLKMAEEKLPIDPVGIKTHVRDPQDRYEHIHQRLALKAAVNGSLCRIAAAFKDDIKGIYLPDEYNRYFQRFICRKNA